MGVSEPARQLKDLRPFLHRPRALVHRQAGLAHLLARQLVQEGGM